MAEPVNHGLLLRALDDLKDIITKGVEITNKTNQLIYDFNTATQSDISKLQVKGDDSFESKVARAFEVRVSGGNNFEETCGTELAVIQEMMDIFKKVIQ